jgi:ribosomal protein S18 acetylase RimI-like enzyme
VEIRQLTATDAAAFQAIRLRALRESPEAFGSTYAEEVDRPLAAVAARLAVDPATSVVLAASLADGAPLVGMVGCYRESGYKRRHVGVVWGLFVAPEARGRGLGHALLSTLVSRVRTWPELEQLTLTVVPDNAAARALYRRQGFQPAGLAPRALRDGARHYDLESFWLPLDAR